MVNMKENGRKEKNKEKVDLLIKMEKYLKEIGKMIKFKELEAIIV